MKKKLLPLLKSTQGDISVFYDRSYTASYIRYQGYLLVLRLYLIYRSLTMEPLLKFTSRSQPAVENGLFASHFSHA